MKTFITLLVTACLVASAYSATCTTSGTNVGNCGACTSANACSSCLAAFSFVSATPACSTACPTQCLYCAAGYTSGTAAQCQNSNSSATTPTATLATSTCNPNGTATTTSGVTTTVYYTPGAQTSGLYECYTCGVSNCSNCNDPSATPTAASSNGGNANCQKCVAGTYLDGNTTALNVNSVQQGTRCTVCPATTVLASPSYSVQCLSCYNSSYCLTAACPTGQTYNVGSQSCKGAFRLAAIGSILIFVLIALAF